jgi:hypothetical protein
VHGGGERVAKARQEPRAERLAQPRLQQLVDRITGVRQAPVHAVTDDRAEQRRAVERLGELIESADERVATVACNSILDRAFGKARIIKDREEDHEVDNLVERLRKMTPEEREADARQLWERIQDDAA